MNRALLVGGAFVLGLAIGARALRAADSSCCQRVAFGGRDKIAGYAGPFSGLVSGLLDTTGLTQLIPGALDKLGIPKDA